MSVDTNPAGWAPEPRQSTPPTQLDPDLLTAHVADGHIEGDDQ